MIDDKEKIRLLATEMIAKSFAESIKKIDKALRSGCIDVAMWSENNNPMLVPKALVIAILLDEANQYSAKGTSHEKYMKKEVKNISLFI